MKRADHDLLCFIPTEIRIVLQSSENAGRRIFAEGENAKRNNAKLAKVSRVRSCCQSATKYKPLELDSHNLRRLETVMSNEMSDSSDEHFD